MKEVQPIRDFDKIEQMKTELLKRSYRDYFLFVFGIHSGLRISDILKLKVKDVRNKNHISMKEEKTDKEKRFKINYELQEEIEKYIQNMDEEEYLFKSKKTNKPIQRVQAYKILNDTAKKIGLEEIGTHTLRKTFGYWFYQQTKDIAILQKIFNHSAPSITMRYIGIEQDQIDQAIDNFSYRRG